jgi:hypothetical protein
MGRQGRHRTREVSADRARSFAALKDWPDEALAYMQEVFERRRQGAGGTLAELLADLKAKFNVEWNDSSLSRYYGFWEEKLYVEKLAHEQAIAMAEHFLDGGRATEDGTRELLQQLLEHQRLVALSNLGKADPAEVAALGLASDRIDLARNRMEWEKERAAGSRHLAEARLQIDRELADLERRKVELREKMVQVPDRIEEKAKAAGKTLDPEVARMIREEVYGLPT